MKKIIKISTFLIFFSFIIIILGNNFMSQDSSHNDLSYALVSDVKNEAELPRRFRTTNLHSIDKLENINLNGFTQLKISGSGQFTESSLKKALSHIESENIIIVDLRKEAHGFINGNPVSWYIGINNLNWNETYEYTINFENNLLNNLKEKETASIFKLKKIGDESKVEYVDPVETKLTLVESEKELLARNNLRYVRFTVTDYHKPESDQVDKFISFIDKLPKDAWLYFHCRGGSGRSTTFMVMYDIIKNGKDINLEDIIQRHTLIGGKELNKLPKDHTHWKYDPALGRYNFIKQFYKYVTDQKGYGVQTWSEWLQDN